MPTRKEEKKKGDPEPGGMDGWMDMDGACQPRRILDRHVFNRF